MTHVVGDCNWEYGVNSWFSTYTDRYTNKHKSKCIYAYACNAYCVQSDGLGRMTP